MPETIERDYERKYSVHSKRNLSYLFSQGKTNYMIVCLPQGRRTAEYFAEHYRIFPKDWSVLILDLPGLGKSDKFGPDSTIENSARLIMQTLERGDFDFDKIVIYGKSFSSHIAYEMLSLNPSFLAGIVVAGPRLFSKSAARFLFTISTMASRSTILRIVIEALVRIRIRIDPITAPHIDDGDTDIWHQLRSISGARFRAMKPIETRCLLIQNGVDELIPPENLADIQQAFVNAESKTLNTSSHWESLSMDEQDFIQAFLKQLSSS